MIIMQKWAIIFLTIFVLFFSSCRKEGLVVYIKMPNNQTISEKYKEKVRFRGVQIGEIGEKIILHDGYILLTATIDKKNKYRFTDAVYREDLLGNTYVELIAEPSEWLFGDKQLLDTLYGSYAPLYHNVDSGSKSKILKEVGSIKNRLDSLLEKK